MTLIADYYKVCDITSVVCDVFTVITAHSGIYGIYIENLLLRRRKVTNKTTPPLFVVFYPWKVE